MTGGLQGAAAAKDQSEYAVSEQINNAHTGSIDFAAGFTPPLVRAWTIDLGLGEYPKYQAIVADNRVVVTATGVDIYSLDLATGKRKWKHSLPCCNEQGAYDRGKLFFLSDSGLLTALSAKSGNEIWRMQLTGESSFPVGPLASGGRVFMNGEGINAIAYSVRERDGKLRWTQNLIGAGVPSLGDGGLFLTSGCFYYRLSAIDGRIIWTNSRCVGGSEEASTYANGRLFVSEFPAGNIVDASDGEIVGTFPSWAGPTATFTRGTKSFGLSLGQTGLDCWDSKTGAIVWQFSDGTGATTTPIVVNGVVYIGTAMGVLYGLDERDGKQVWSDSFGSEYASYLTAGQGALVLTSDSKIMAYRPQ